MRPNVNCELRPTKPDVLPPDTKLEPGYIRYIRILPAEGPNGEICFQTCIRKSLIDGDIDRKRLPEWFFYSAISYSWGDPSPSHTIIVNGHERMVAKNLWYFLQRTSIMRADLRYKKAKRAGRSRVWETKMRDWKTKMRDLGKKMQMEVWTEEVPYGDHVELWTAAVQQRGWPDDWLWIDALCIDQSDARERTHQVKIMSEIFGRADQVISWLGPSYDLSEFAMTTIAGHTPGKHTPMLPFLTQKTKSEAICSLCERPYWKRLWIFQELRHAKHITLMCGDRTVPWDQFRLLWRDVIDDAATDDELPGRLKQSLATRVMTLRTDSFDLSLWNLLKETRNLECADQRDRIYALLSVAKKGHEEMEADYSLTPLYLAHCTLRNKYAIRLPRTLNDILTDCEFLEDVFRMAHGAMLRYCQHHDHGHDNSGDPDDWFRNELRDSRSAWSWSDTRDDWFNNEAQDFSSARCCGGNLHTEGCSYVDVESSQAGLLWSAWASFHHHDAVTTLLLKTRMIVNKPKELRNKLPGFF